MTAEFIACCWTFCISIVGRGRFFGSSCAGVGSEGVSIDGV